MEVNVVNNESVIIKNMEDAFEKQNNVMDELINQMYNYDLYGRYKDPKFTNEIDYAELLNSNKNFQFDILNTLNKEGERLQNTYDYNASIYKDQVITNKRMKNQRDLVQKRYDSINDEIEKNHHNHKSYRYNYYKYRKITTIIYCAIGYIISILVLTIINKNFNFIMNDSIYTLLLTLCTIIFIIFLLINAYDIYIRNKIIFFEYDRNWKPPISAADDEDDEEKILKKDNKLNDEENEKEKC